MKQGLRASLWRYFVAWSRVTGTLQRVVHRERLNMTDDIQRDFGPQPIARLMGENSLMAQDLVSASSEQLTHKMVARACKGRHLTPRIQAKVLTALNTCACRTYTLEDLFTY